MRKFVSNDEVEFGAVQKLAVVLGHSNASWPPVSIGQMASAYWNNVHSIEIYIHAPRQ